MTKYFSKILLVFILICQSHAQDSTLWVPPQKDSLLVILDHAYNLEFDIFDKKAAHYKEQFPERPEALFINVVALWIKMTADLHNPQYDEVFSDSLDEIIDTLEDFDDEDPLYEVAEFYANATSGFKAIIHVARKNWWSAALEGRQAVGGIKDALEGKIPNSDAKLGTGLYLYYADILPGKYPLLKPLFLFYPGGDKKQGLIDLQETIQSGLFAKVVAAYMKGVILYTRERQPSKAYKIMKELTEAYPQNPTFIMWQISIAIALRKYDVALKLTDIYRERIENNRSYYPKHKMRIVNYRYGVIYYKTKKYEKALNYLYEALKPIEEPMESNLERYKVYSLLQAGYALKNLKHYEKAKGMFELVLHHSDFRGSHDIADNHLERIEKITKK
jgi:tetratricopeptide (TPR) repeat protein